MRLSVAISSHIFHEFIILLSHKKLSYRRERALQRLAIVVQGHQIVEYILSAIDRESIIYSDIF